MKQSNISTEELRANELQALQNALHSFNLTGYDVHEWKQRNNKIKGLYFLTDQKGISLTGHWGYSEINHFILGYGKAAKEVIELREENERLKKQVDNFYNELKNTFQ